LDSGGQSKKLREIYNEIKVMKNLKHPHIVSFLGAELLDPDCDVGMMGGGNSSSSTNNNKNMRRHHHDNKKSGKKGERLAIFQEWVPGGSLQDIVSQFGRIEQEAVVARFAYQILEGLTYLHEAGFLFSSSFKICNALITFSLFFKKELFTVM